MVSTIFPLLNGQSSGSVQECILLPWQLWFFHAVGIPGSADLAETYYSQYQDEFEDDDEGEETLVANEEIDDFIHYMQTALNKSDAREYIFGRLSPCIIWALCSTSELSFAVNLTSTLVAADSSGDPFGPSFRDVRIKNLRAYPS